MQRSISEGKRTVVLEGPVITRNKMLRKDGLTSLRSKRFRGFRGKELPREKRGGRGMRIQNPKSRGLSASVSFLPLPHPLFLILAFSPISCGQNTVYGLSLLPNPTETLATQATASLVHSATGVIIEADQIKGHRYSSILKDFLI